MLIRVSELITYVGPKFRVVEAFLVDTYDVVITLMVVVAWVAATRVRVG